MANGYFNSLGPSGSGIFPSMGGYQPPGAAGFIGAALQDIAAAGRGQQGAAVATLRRNEQLARQNELERERLRRQETREEETLRIRRDELALERAAQQEIDDIYAGDDLAALPYMPGPAGPGQPVAGPEQQGSYAGALAEIEATGMVPGKYGEPGAGEEWLHGLDALESTLTKYYPDFSDLGTELPGVAPAGPQVPPIAAPVMGQPPAPRQAPTPASPLRQKAGQYMATAERLRNRGHREEAAKAEAAAFKLYDEDRTRTEFQERNQGQGPARYEAVGEDGQVHNFIRATDHPDANELGYVDAGVKPGGKGITVYDDEGNPQVQIGGSQDLTTTTKNAIQKQQRTANQVLDQSAVLRDQITEEMFQIPERIGYTLNSFLEKMGSGDLSDKDKQEMGDFYAAWQATEQMIAPLRHEMFGSAFTVNERKVNEGLFPQWGNEVWAKDGWTGFNRKLESMQNYYRRANIRNSLALSLGLDRDVQSSGAANIEILSKRRAEALQDEIMDVNPDISEAELKQAIRQRLDAETGGMMSQWYMGGKK